jgi:hypothetical protein
MQNPPSPAKKKIVFLAAIGLVTTGFGESSCKLLNEETLFCHKIARASKSEDILDVMKVT